MGTFEDAFDAEAAVVVLLDPERRIRAVNRAWSIHAERDGAPATCSASSVLGRDYLDFIAGELRARFVAAFEKAAADEAASVLIHSECNTPQLFRALTTRIFKLTRVNGDGRPGFLVQNDLRVVGPLSEHHSLLEADAEQWRDARGVLNQCGSCRRLRHPDRADWSMVLQAIEQRLARVSHGLCPLCFETCYGDAALGPEQ